MSVFMINLTQHIPWSKNCKGTATITKEEYRIVKLAFKSVKDISDTVTFTYRIRSSLILPIFSNRKPY